MRVTDMPAYQSQWLTAADLQGKARRLTIAELKLETVRQRDGATVEKVAVSFAGAKKRLLLNATQAKVLDTALGDMEHWPGRMIILQPARTPQGQETIGIVVLPLAPAPERNKLLQVDPERAKGNQHDDPGNPFDE